MIGLLVAVALAATVLALGFQTYLGRSPFIAGVGTALSATGAVALALWASRRFHGGS
jgi:hypothetical protein